MSILDTLLKDPSVLKGAMSAIGFDPAGLVGSVNRFAQAITNISEKIDPQVPAAAAVAATPLPAVVEVPAALPLPQEGYVRDHTGALVALADIVKAIQAAEVEKQKQIPVPPSAPRICGTCSSSNSGQPNIAATLCLSCYTAPGLPNYAAKAAP